MFKNLSWEAVWGGVLRHVLTFGGGALVTMGVLDEATLTSLIGAVGTIGGFLWSLAVKKSGTVLK